MQSQYLPTKSEPYRLNLLAPHARSYNGHPSTRRSVERLVWRLSASPRSTFGVCAESDFFGLVSAVSDRALSHSWASWWLAGGRTSRVDIERRACGSRWLNFANQSLKFTDGFAKFELCVSRIANFVVSSAFAVVPKTLQSRRLFKTNLHSPFVNFIDVEINTKAKLFRIFCCHITKYKILLSISRIINNVN
jgi:hypothetical protein